MSNPSNDRVKIALRENGLHSLWKGIAAYEIAKKDNDNVWSFKDAIMFIHHGVELLMKQILVNHSEYLIFEDLSDSTVKKQKVANEEGVGVFFLPRAPRTVTYSNAIRRVEAFLSPKELDEALVSRLDELNSLRNQIEHYAVDLDKQEVTTLLGKIREPLLDLLDTQLGGIRESQPVQVIKAWESITSGMERGLAAEKRVAAVVARFKGQTIKGEIFTTDSSITLPVVFEVHQSRQWTIGETRFETDVFAEGDESKWVAEVKASQRLQREAFYRVKFNAHLLNATPWLVFMGVATDSNKQIARSLGVFLTDGPKLIELEELLTDS